MANINNQLDVIRNASDGKSVRNTICETINKINTEGGDAMTFDGKRLDDFVKMDELISNMNVINGKLQKKDSLLGSGEMLNKTTKKAAKDSDKVDDIDYTGDTGYMVTTKGFYAFFDNVNLYPGAN